MNNSTPGAVRMVIGVTHSGDLIEGVTGSYPQQSFTVQHMAKTVRAYELATQRQGRLWDDWAAVTREMARSNEIEAVASCFPVCRGQHREYGVKPATRKHRQIIKHLRNAGPEAIENYRAMQDEWTGSARDLANTCIALASTP